MNNELTDCIDISDLCNKYKFLKRDSIRWILHQFKGHKDLEECLFRMGRRIYFKEVKFLKFLQSYSPKKATIVYSDD